MTTNLPFSGDRPRGFFLVTRGQEMALSKPYLSPRPRPAGDPNRTFAKPLFWPVQ